MKDLNIKEERISKLFFGYAVPTIIGICILSLYTLVDSIFVSRYCGELALSAVEICSPVLSVFSCISIVIGVGANTLIGISLGEENNEKASKIFTLSVIMILVFALLFGLLMLLFTGQVASLFGADETVMNYVCDYLKICGWFAPAFLISGLLSLVMETIGLPVVSMLGNIVSALGNILLDYIFVVKENFGVKGAAVASGISVTLSVLICLAFFVFKNKKLKICLPDFDLKLIFKMIYNGSSEGLSAVSMGVISYVYNVFIIKLTDTNHLASFSVALTVMNFVGSVIIGASQGINPIVSVNFGAKKYERVNKAVKIFIFYEIVIALLSDALICFVHEPIIGLFAIQNEELTWTICKAYLPVLVFTPISVVIISYFTSVNNAKISAILSLFRTFIIRLGVIVLMYFTLGINGIWFSATVSEFISLIVCLVVYKKENHNICII